MAEYRRRRVLLSTEKEASRPLLSASPLLLSMVEYESASSPLPSALSLCWANKGSRGGAPYGDRQGAEKLPGGGAAAGWRLRRSDRDRRGRVGYVEGLARNRNGAALGARSEKERTER